MARKKKKTDGQYAKQFPETLIGEISGLQGKHFAETCKAVTIVATDIALPMVGPDVAEDIGSRTYLAFLKRLEKQADFLVVQKILDYVRRKAQRLSRKELEKEKRYVRADNVFEDCALQSLEHLGDSSSHAEFKELKDLVIKSILALPNEIQQTFYLAREEGLKQREIAERINTSQGTVSLRLSAALEAIAAAIGPHVAHSGLALPPRLAAYLVALQPASDQRNQ